MPDVFAYGDYRKFLAACYAEEKAKDRHFSYQRLAQLAGFNTKTFLFKVIKGEKALADESIGKVAHALCLSGGEAAYFQALVRFNEGKTVQERERYFGELRSFKYTREQVRLRANEFAYFSKWYHVVIREIVTLIDFHDDYRVLAKAVIPRIRPDQARSAVRLLLKLGLIEKLDSGKYRQTRADLTTGDEVISTAVARFQKDTMNLASQALDRFPRDAREISTLTMGLSAKAFETVKRDLQAYRKHLIEIAASDEPADRVFQLNMQLFPVSVLAKKLSRTGAGR
jgi:uncharacterized protein (TIGR02147 family)